MAIQEASETRTAKLIKFSAPLWIHFAAYMLNLDVTRGLRNATPLSAMGQDDASPHQAIRLESVVIAAQCLLDFTRDLYEVSPIGGDKLFLLEESGSG